MLTTYQPLIDLIGWTGFLIGFAIYGILVIAGYWKMFVKGGQPGWKSIIPLYDTYIAYKITWKTAFFWLTVIIAAVVSLSGQYSVDKNIWFWVWVNTLAGIGLLVLDAMTCYKMAKAYGKGTGTAIGLFFLKPIFVIILGFGSAEYKGAQD